MNKHTSKVLLGLAITGLPVAANAAPLTLAQNGQPNATIVLQADAPKPMQAAAADLQEYLTKLSGVKLPLTTDGKDVPGITLNVGKTASTIKSDFPDSALNPETYAITQRNDDIYFEGNYPSPTAFAVYSFLQDQLGVRWFAPGDDWEFVPSNDRDKSTFTVDVKDVVSVPGLSPRVWSGHQWTQDWKDWNLRNKAVQSEKVLHRNFQNYLYHAFPPSKYAKTHPEYYPLVNGERWIPGENSGTHWWPCIGNPDVQRITAEYIHQWFKDNPDKDSFSLGADDVSRWCEGPLCRAMDASPSDPKTNNYSSRYYKFVNIVAEQVAKTDPGKDIGVLIYRYKVKPPVDLPKMQDNIFGYIADGSAAQWFRPGKKAEFMHRSREWRERISHLSRYDYYGMGTFVPRVFPHAMAEEIKFDKSLGFEGMYTEVYTFLPHTAPMIWAFAQLQWDPEKNIDTLLHDFYSKMYPSAPQTMHAYYDLMEYSWNAQRDGHNTGWVHRNLVHQAASISPEAVHQGMDLLNIAYEKAQTPVEKRRIDVVRGGLKFASYAVLEYDLAKQLASAPITDENQAAAVLAKAQHFADLVSSRKEFWAKAIARKDLLGANLRGLINMPYLEQDFSPLVNPAIPGIVRLVDWYQENQPAKADAIAKNLLAKLPAGYMKDALEASRFLSSKASKNAKSLLTNGDFENTAKNTADAEHDWETKGIPVGWSSWSRNGRGEFTRTTGRTEGSSAVHMVAPKNADTSVLLQRVSAKPGQRFVAVAWVKLDDPEKSSDVGINFRYRNKDGWYDKAGTPEITSINTQGWQKLILAATIPDNVTGFTLMLNVNNASATYDDVQVYELPK